jgi:hypothetical protein
VSFIVRRFDAESNGALALETTNIRRDGINGPLVVTARAARTGNQRYAHGLEHRAAAEVFAKDSLDSLIGAPVTRGHPPDMVTRDNVAELSGGYIRSAKRDGNFIEVVAVIDEKTMIADVESGALAELSCGYTCDLSFGGTFDGERVVGSQRNIRHNHVALGPRGWARCGSACSIG